MTPPRSVPAVALLMLAAACGTSRPSAATSAEAPPAQRGSDAAADSLLVDVRSADSTIQVDARYAGPNNFTGAPLPGYEAPRALLRREAAAALGRVQRRLRSGGLGLKVFDGYRPVRATEAMVAWTEREGRPELVDSGDIAPGRRPKAGGRGVPRAAEPPQHGGRGGPDHGGPRHRHRGADGDRVRRVHRGRP